MRLKSLYRTAILVVVVVTSCWPATARAGGEASAITFQAPQGFITMVNDPATGSVINTFEIFKLAGSRCQYAGLFSEVGFSVAASGIPDASSNVIVVPHGAPAPVLEVWSDTNSGNPYGGPIASATASLIGSSPSNYVDYYAASLQTECVGGSRDGELCNANEACPGGACRTCDQTGSCNSDTDAGSCSGTCALVLGSCHSSADCPYNLPCEFKATGAQACYVQADCCSGSACGSGHDCTKSGLDTAGNSGPIHTAVARITEGGAVISYAERVYQMVKGNSKSPTTQCSTNCDGPVDASNAGQPPPNCEN